MRSVLSSGAAVISGVGLCTPLGMTSLASFAAFRAGMHYAADTETIGREGEPLRAAYLRLLPFGKTRHERMLDPATRALDDLAGSLHLETHRRIAVFLGLPDPLSLPGFEAEAFVAALTPILRARLPNLHNHPHLFYQGRSVFFFTLEAALLALTSGTCDAAVIGAVDSMCAPEVLTRLDNERRLLGSSMSDGILPGEGAAFVLMEQATALQAKENSRALAVILCVSTDRESRHLQQNLPNRAQALSRVLHSLRKHPASQEKRADLLFTCETGERFWADEILMAYLRNASIMPEPFVRTMAAENFGDLDA